MNSKLLHRLIIGIFVSLYLITSTISTIHSIDFFQIANSYLMSIFLAIAFEVGAAGSLAALIIKNKMNMVLVWSIFIVLTLFQIMNNVYFSFMHLGDFVKWSELFGLNEEDMIQQKRIVSIVLGAVLPLIALGFIKALVDYISPTSPTKHKEDVVVSLNDVVTKDNKNIITDDKVHQKEESVVNRLNNVKDNINNLIEEELTIKDNINNLIEEELTIKDNIEKSEQMDSILNDDLERSLNAIRRGGM